MDGVLRKMFRSHTHKGRCYIAAKAHWYFTASGSSTGVSWGLALERARRAPGHTGTRQREHGAGDSASPAGERGGFGRKSGVPDAFRRAVASAGCADAQRRV